MTHHPILFWESTLPHQCVVVSTIHLILVCLEAAAVPNLTSPALLRSQRPAVRSSAGGMSANSPSLAYITIISLCDDFMQSGCDGYLDM